jgi:hypothetical protein
MKKYFAAAAMAVALSAAPAAQANGLLLEGNVARAHSEWGGEVGVGYNLSFGGFTLRPIAGAFIYQGDNDRYYEDTFSNGQSRCRDSETGQFAKDSKCDDAAVKAYGKIEATYTIAGSLELGGGARFSSEKVRPYGTFSFPVSPKLRIKGNAGDRYYAAGLRLDF